MIFVTATIVFYSVALNRKREIEEKHIHPGGISPVWVRYASLIVTVLMLIATFWFAVAHREFAIRHRVPRPGILNRNPVQSAPPAGAAVDTDMRVNPAASSPVQNPAF